MAEQGIKAFAGPLFFAAFALLFFGAAWAMWPADVFSTPFAEMPAGMLLRAVASPMLAIVGLEFLGAFVISLVADG